MVFGEVRAMEVHLSRLGAVAEAEWVRTFDLRATLVRDAFVVMPNRAHLLFGILDAPDLAEAGTADTMHGVPTDPVNPSATLDRTDTMNGVSVDTNRSPDSTRRFGQHLPKSALWQGRFHDRVVRNDREADAIRRYIHDNPARWTGDRVHPDPLPPPRCRGGRGR